MQEKRLKEPMPKDPDPGAPPKGFAPGPAIDPEHLRGPIIAFQRLKQMAKDQKDQLAQTNVLLAEKQFECVKLLELYGLHNARLDGVGLVTVVPTDHVSIPKETESALFEELRSRGMGDVIKTEPTVNSKTLASLVKELREGGEAPLQNAKVFTEMKISIRK